MLATTRVSHRRLTPVSTNQLASHNVSSQLGTHKRAKAKREEMTDVIAAQRKAQLASATAKKKLEEAKEE